MMPELRQEMKMVATRRRMTLDAAYLHEGVGAIQPRFDERFRRDLRDVVKHSFALIRLFGVWLSLHGATAINERGDQPSGSEPLE